MCSQMVRVWIAKIAQSFIFVSPHACFHDSATSVFFFEVISERVLLASEDWAGKSGKDPNGAPPKS